MADDDQAAAVALEEPSQPDDGVGVEVVGRLVEQQRLRAAEQDPGQLHPAPLTAGQRPQRLGQDPVLEAEAVGDLGGLGLSGVAAPGVQLGVGPGVAAHRAVGDRRVGAAHLDLGLAQASYDVVESARGEDPVEGDHLGVAGARVLGQVADLAGRQHLARGGQAFPGEDAGEGRLAGPVAADQTDLVAGGDPEGHVRHQQPRPGPDFEVLGGDHQGR